MFYGFRVEASRNLEIMVSGFQGLKVLRFQRFEVSRNQGFKVFKNLSFRVMRYLRNAKSMIPRPLENLYLLKIRNNDS
jgi:hypothetical protein